MLKNNYRFSEPKKEYSCVSCKDCEDLVGTELKFWCRVNDMYVECDTTCDKWNRDSYFALERKINRLIKHEKMEEVK